MIGWQSHCKASTQRVSELIVLIVLTLTLSCPLFAQSTTGNTVTIGGDVKGGVVAGGNITNTTVDTADKSADTSKNSSAASNAPTQNRGVLSWLTNNAVWLGALAAIVTIIAFLIPLLSKKRPLRETTVPTGGSVANGPVTNTSTQGATGSPASNSETDQNNVIRVLVVFANPKDTDPLRMQEESRVLLESIQLSTHRSSIECETLPAATIDDLRRALLKQRYDIVHFSGHGTDDGMVFEDAIGLQMIPSSQALADLLIRNKIGTAVFNACHSLSVGSFASAGLDFTIASTDTILDPAAIEFTRGFYDAIGANKSVEYAYQEGMSSAQLKGFSPKIVLLRRGEVYSPEHNVEPSQ